MTSKPENHTGKEKHIKYMKGTKLDSDSPAGTQKKSPQQVQSITSATVSGGSKDRGGKSERKDSVISSKSIIPKELPGQLAKPEEPGNECKITFPKQFLLRFYEKISKYPVYWDINDQEVEKMLQDFYKPSPCYERRLRNRALREKEAIEREKLCNKTDVDHCRVVKRVDF